MKIINIDEISTGIRLKQLLEERNLSNKRFVKQFNLWLENEQSKGNYTDEPELREKDFSRWTRKNNPVQMRDNKIKMFADFFGVDENYLNCTQVEKRQTDRIDFSQFDRLVDLEELRRGVEAAEREDYIIDLLKNLGYAITEIPIGIKDTDTFQFIEEKKLVTATDSCTVNRERRITDKDGVIRIINSKTFYDNIEKYIKFEVSQLEPADSNSQND